MKKQVLKASAYFVLTMLLAITISQIPVTGQILKEHQAPYLEELGVEKAELSKGNKAIEGTWQLQVTPRNCLTGDPIATFPSLVTYAGGGTSISTTSSLSPALNYPGQGVWQYVGNQRYTGGFMFFRFNSSGTFIGTQKITQEIEYDGALDQLNITATFEVLDSGGNVVGTGCATAVGTRFEV